MVLSQGEHCKVLWWMQCGACDDVRVVEKKNISGFQEPTRVLISHSRPAQQAVAWFVPVALKSKGKPPCLATKVLDPWLGFRGSQPFRPLLVVGEDAS